MNFYKRFLGDYARDTAHLSITEHGAYTLLLDALYGTGKPLPADLDALCRMCRASSAAERRAVESIANQFFPINGDGFRHNARADREIQAHEEQAEINRAIAKDRETKRANDRRNDKSTNRSTEREPSHSQSHKERKTKGVYQPPDWVPSGPWKAYVEMRDEIKKPMTYRAAELAVDKLAALRDLGMAPAAVLEQSVFNSWQGLFPLKSNGSGGEKKVAL